MKAELPGREKGNCRNNDDGYDDGQHGEGVARFRGASGAGTASGSTPRAGALSQNRHRAHRFPVVCCYGARGKRAAYQVPAVGHLERHRMVGKLYAHFVRIRNGYLHLVVRQAIGRSRYAERKELEWVDLVSRRVGARIGCLVRKRGARGEGERQDKSRQKKQQRNACALACRLFARWIRHCRPQVTRSRPCASKKC